MKKVKEIRKFVLKTDLPGGFVKGDVPYIRQFLGQKPADNRMFL